MIATIAGYRDLCATEWLRLSKLKHCWGLRLRTDHHGVNKAMTHSQKVPNFMSEHTLQVDKSAIRI